MIQSAHILTGAAIAVVAKNPWLAIPGALLSHYLLDLVPHKEYAIDRLHKLAEEGDFSWKMIFDLSKGALDIFWSALAVVWLTNGATLPILCALIAIIPDLFHPIDILFARRRGLPYPQFHENPYEQFSKGLTLRFLSWQRRLHFRMHILEREFVPRWMGLTTQLSTIFAGSAALFLFGTVIT